MFSYIFITAFSIITIIIITNCKWVYTRWQSATMQDRKIHYSTINTIQYITLTHITQNNIQHSRQSSIRKITIKIKNTYYYTIKRQKRVEPLVDESVLQTARYTKQWVNRTIDYSVKHILARSTPHSTSLTL
jgi:hypothetical protein